VSEITEHELSEEFKRLYPALIRFGQSPKGVRSRVDAEDLVLYSFVHFICNLRAGKEFSEHIESCVKTIIKNIHNDQLREKIG